MNQAVEHNYMAMDMATLSLSLRAFSIYQYLKIIPHVQAVDISRTDYEPSDMDILYAEGITLSNSLASMEFSFPKPIDEDSVFPEFRHDPSFRSDLHLLVLYVRIHFLSSHSPNFFVMQWSLI